MKRGFHWLAISCVALMIQPGSPSLLYADDADTRAPTPVIEPMGFVGTVIAVVPASRTLVVDVAWDGGFLRIGAEVTDTTRITADGQAVPLDRVQTGDRVRITVRWIETGNEAVAVEVLSGRRG